MYQHNPVHRNGAKGKTQWSPKISIAAEEMIFRIGEAQGWVAANSIFSVRFDGSPKSVEVIDTTGELNFAHFTGDAVWHGWPANPLRSPHDLPPYVILSAWVASKLTTRSRVAKLRRLQRCAI